ncbi:hypothetical protein T265_00419 [Opisthorchis viverrini]|uniref:Reverse transcriptase domain-containing protein n=1 Tax=Opisthorchis viverrini TaxID=6198 RepID=A0A075A311_OPIVI|nr:hypothetical protein T265_00419 [Opisthorchis viverrini]KER33731.1 hypothetical protein T265_00419 [Opisthorchis viverrini]
MLLDFKNASHSIDRSVLLYTFVSNGVPQKFLDINRSLHSRTFERATVYSEVCKSFPTKKWYPTRRSAISTLVQPRHRDAVIILLNFSATRYLTSLSWRTLSVPNCHATRRLHEGWDTARLPKITQEKSRGRDRVRATDLPVKSWPSKENWIVNMEPPLVSLLKRHRAAGPDDLPPALFKDRKVPIFEKGTRSECSNHRGVSLTPRLLAPLILHRLAVVRETFTSENQAGFRRGRGHVDHVFTLRLVL